MADFAEWLRGMHDDLVPPRRMIHNIGGSFGAVGEAFLQHFVQLGGLRRGEAVLDVGCGVGRMAVPLTAYLGVEGRYEGFDIDAGEIKWCTRHVTSRYPNFRFRVADTYSKRYNPVGHHQASDYVFPYADETFDFALMTSVCTHLLQADMDHYLHETARVLRHGGRTFITWFLLNEESTDLVAQQRSSLEFRYGRNGCRVLDDAIPEEAVAYGEDIVRAAYARNELDIVAPIRYGTWCGRPEGYDYQDIIVARKQ